MAKANIAQSNTTAGIENKRVEQQMDFEMSIQLAARFNASALKKVNMGEDEEEDEEEGNEGDGLDTHIPQGNDQAPVGVSPPA